MRHPKAMSALPQSQPSRTSNDDGRLRQGCSRSPRGQESPLAPSAVMAADPSTESVTASARPSAASVDAGTSVIGSAASPSALLALDLGTTTGWASRVGGGAVMSGSVSFRGSRFDGGGMRFLRFRGFLDGILANAGGLDAIYFEEVRRHLGTDAAHLYGGFLATLSTWCEERRIAYEGVPVGSIKRHVTGKGNADKALVIEAVRARGFDPEDDNEADALAILLWAVETQGAVS